MKPSAEALGEFWGNQSPKQPFMSMRHYARMVRDFWLYWLWEVQSRGSKTDSNSVESAMAPRVQIPISPPLHMSKALGMPGVPGALSFLASVRASPLRGGRESRAIGQVVQFS